MGRKISVVLSDEVYKEVEGFRRESLKEDGSVQTRGWAVETLLKMGLGARAPRRTQET